MEAALVSMCGFETWFCQHAHYVKIAVF